MVEWFKNTEIGAIPNDWDVKEFGELTDKIIGGGTPSRSNPLFWGNEIPWVTVKDFATFKSTQTQEYITKEGLKNSASHLIPKGILITSTRMALGKTVIYDVDVSINQDLKAIFPKETIDTNFFYYWFQFNSKFIEDLGSGSTVMGISLPDLKKIKIKLPTKVEQTAIATALNDADALITQLEKLIAKKKAIKQGAMLELLKPKEGWVEKNLGDIGVFKNGINKAIGDFGFGYPFVNLMDVFGKTNISTNLHLGLINSNSADRKLYDLKEGDVVFIRSSVKPQGVGLTCVIKEDLIDTVFSGFIIRFRDNGALTTSFKEHCFYSTDFRNRLISSSTVSANTNINQVALSDLIISFPKEKEEQNRIASILSGMDLEILKLEVKLEKQKQLKQGMMQSLLTGKIRLV